MAGIPEALILQMSADIRGLEKQMKRAGVIVDDTTGQMVRRSKAANDNLTRTWNKTGGVVTGALEGMAAHAPLAAGGLTALGGAGLAAAAGIGAFAAALAGARQAAQFADELSDTANRLHVTTDALQEYRYAIRLAGGDEKGADEALEKFSVTLGKAQEGVAKATKAFKALGFTQEEINRFTSAEDALQQVGDRVSEITSSPQRDAIIEQLGLKGLKPLIEQGGEAMRKLRAEAHELGVVMDADLIAKGAEANDQFETLSKIIDVQLKSALVSLAPVLVGLLQLAAQIAGAIGDVVGKLQAVEERQTSVLRRQRAAIVSQSTMLSGRALSGDPVAQRITRENDAAIARIDSELASRARSAPASAGVIRGRDISGSFASGGGGSAKVAKADKADTDPKSVKDLAATRELLDLQLKLEVARERENKHLTQALEDQIDRLRLIDQFQDAGFTAAEARRKAEAQITELVKARAAAEKDDALAAELAASLAKQQAAIEAANESLARGAEDLNRTYKDVANDGLASLVDGLAGAAAGMNSLGDVAKRVLQQLTYDLTKLNLERMLGMGGQGGSGGGFGDILKTGLSLFGGSMGGSSGSLGSSFNFGGTGGFNFTGFASGGKVSGPGTGTSDSIPAMLSNGEFVVNAAQARKYRALLEAINGGHVPHLKGGGFLGGLFGGAVGGLLSGNFLMGGVAGSLAKKAGLGGGALGLLSGGKAGFGQLVPKDILKGLTKGGGKEAAAQSFAPTLNITINHPGGQIDPRRTASQIGAETMRQMAAARKSGF